MNTAITRRSFLQGAGLAAVAAAGCLTRPATGAEGPAAPKDVSDLLEAIRKEHRLPGIAAAALGGGRILAEGVAGVRQVGKEDRIALDDRFAIGSCTKRMTLLMTARLVDAGKLSFETTLAEALPDAPMRDDYRKVTVAQLLDFTGGIQPYLQIGPRRTPVLFQEGTTAERRERFVKHLLQEEPVAKPGSRSQYSNASYALVAYIAARRTGREYAALMDEHVFRPLGMTRAGVGRPRSKDRPNEPWLHLKEDKGYVPEPDTDRPAMAVFEAAGNVHCSIRDFARFAAYELSAARGKDALLTPATARRVQQLDNADGSGERVIAGGAPWLSAALMLSPGDDFAAVAAVNGGDAHKACREAIEAVRNAV
jgi:CubicO group peptidase (beta-lactamase class C family)